MAEDHAYRHALVVQFMGDVLKRTIDCPTVEAHRQALQTFLDALSPWVTPTDLPTLLRQPFTLFDHLAFTPHGDDEEVSVALSPAGEAFFRAWLRQRGVDPFLCSWLSDEVLPALSTANVRELLQAVFPLPQLTLEQATDLVIMHRSIALVRPGAV